jgi:GntR family transcriptional regulator of vanillate catabolism
VYWLQYHANWIQYIKKDGDGKNAREGKALSRQSQRVIAEIRKMIVSGELAPGERVVETPLAERLGVSRMPVRTALPALEQEGLLERAGKRGYRVRPVRSADIADAIEVRGTLEGLAARLAAEKGLSTEHRAAFAQCLADGDAVFASGEWRDGGLSAYHDMNDRFHRILVEAGGNTAIANALSRNDSLPFASASAIAIDRDHLAQEFERLKFAHMQHHIAVEAIAAGQGARAEAVMREHANAAMRYAELFGDDKPAPANLRVIVGGVV